MAVAFRTVSAVAAAFRRRMRLRPAFRLLGCGPVRPWKVWGWKSPLTPLTLWLEVSCAVRSVAVARRRRLSSLDALAADDAARVLVRRCRGLRGVVVADVTAWCCGLLRVPRPGAVGAVRAVCLRLLLRSGPIPVRLRRRIRGAQFTTPLQYRVSVDEAMLLLARK
jgi:hypothetical protein